jgi:sec-independent protein translocase protein TatC
MPFLDHLAEMRVRMMIVLITGCLALGVGLLLAPSVLGWLMQPLLAAMEVQNAQPHPRLLLSVDSSGDVTASILKPGTTTAVSLTTETLSLLQGARLALQLGRNEPVPLAGPGSRSGSLFFLSPLEPFMLLLKTAAIVALILTIPMAAYQSWLFVAPGLLSLERRVLAWTLAAIVFLFPLGAAFAYAISRIMLTVLIGFSATIPGLEPSLVAGQGVSFILTMMFAFGLVFEFPLVLVFLSRLGVVSADYLVRWRRTAIVLLALMAAFATPSPDPFSMLAMFVPLVILYEASIIAIRRLEPAMPRRNGIGATLRQESY